MGFHSCGIRVAFPGENQLRQSRASQPTVHAECFIVSIIHRTLTWTTGSLTCDVNACDRTQGCTDTVRECTEGWPWEKNPLPHRGIEPASAACRSDAVSTELHSLLTCFSDSLKRENGSSCVRCSRNQLSFRTRGAEYRPVSAGKQSSMITCLVCLICESPRTWRHGEEANICRRIIVSNDDFGASCTKHHPVPQRNAVKDNRPVSAEEFLSTVTCRALEGINQFRQRHRG